MNAIIGDNGIITKAQEAKIMSRFSQYDEELKINCIDDASVYAVKDKIRKYIPSFMDQDLDNFVVIKSRLLYVGTNETELEIANKLGLCGEDSLDARATVTEIQEIIDSIVELKDKFPDEKDSTNDNTETGFIGTKLLDRQNHLFDGSWNILIDYNSSNRETERYETGYWLEKGKTYKINGKSLKFKNDYVIDYENKKFNVLSNNMVNWNKNATLGVKDDIVLDLDSMALENGEWKDSEVPDDVSSNNFFNFYSNAKETGIQKVGDVIYDYTNKSLNFNKSNIDEVANYNGYLKLNKSSVDFTKGFTFEIYCSPEKIFYNNLSETKLGYGGLFCVGHDLANAVPWNFLRFGTQSPNVIWGKAGGSYGWNEDVGDKSVCYTSSASNQFNLIRNNLKNVSSLYLTFVYRTYDSINEENNDEFMNSKQADRCEFYIDGLRAGVTYVSHLSFEDGMKVWGTDEDNFFIGVCPTEAIGNLYFFVGDVYTVRLYNKFISEADVKLNHDMTFKYRESFKNK